MDPQTATRVLIEGGKSDAFIAATELLAQSEAQGGRKFARPVVHEVVRALSCRAHGPLVHQLCHLLAAAEQYPAGAWDLLWGDRPATPGTAAAWFRSGAAQLGEAARPRVTITETGIRIDYIDSGFGIPFSQIPVLIGLAELLITTVEFPEVDTARAAVAGRDTTAATVGTASNTLARRVYAYLSEHLPPAQESRVFQRILGFLEQYYGADFDVRQVDDEAILQLWETLSGEEGFRTISGVVANVIRFRQTLDSTAERIAFDHPTPIGGDREAGEVDPSDIHGVVTAIHERRSPLDILDTPPAQGIKFLNDRERRELKMLVFCGDLAPLYWRSLLRAEVFGPLQRRIAQALRSKSNTVGEVIAKGPDHDYDGQREKFAALASHIERMRKATLGALLRTRHEDAVPLAVRFAPSTSRQALANALADTDMPDATDQGENVVAFPMANVAERALDALQDPERVGTDMARLVADAGKALGGLSRQGFRPPLDGDGFAAAEPALADLEKRLSAFTAALDGADTALSDLYAADADRVRTRLTALYDGGDT